MPAREGDLVEWSLKTAFNVIGILTLLVFTFIVIWGPIQRTAGYFFDFERDSPYKESSNILDMCNEFREDFFLKIKFDGTGYFKEFQEQGLFLTDSEELGYRKAKLLCGAMVPIAEEAKGGNLGETISLVNAEFGKIYRFELDAAAIEEALSVEGYDVWVDMLMNAVLDELEAID